MLVYYLVNMKDRFIQENVNLYSKLNIQYDSLTKSLNIELNPNYLEEYWGSNISSLTTIAGENGVGKTSILEMIKDRFIYGLDMAESCILIYEIDKKYKVFCRDFNANMSNEIIINSQNYTFNNFENFFDGIILEIEGYKFEIWKMNDSSKEVLHLNNARINSRIAKNHSLIYYTNHWNYSKLHRDLRISAKQKELDYFDISLANRIDTLIQNQFKFIPPISDIEDMYKINLDNRFPIDYLYKLKEQEIFYTLKYLSSNSNREVLKKYLSIPEEIYIYYDFMNSEKRSVIGVIPSNKEDENNYLRFENTKLNFTFETSIYKWIFKDVHNKMKIKQSLILVIFERFFTDLNLMIVVDKVKAEINLIPPIEIPDYKGLPQVLEYYKPIVLKVIMDSKETRVFDKESKHKLSQYVTDLFDSYIAFLSYILEEFLTNDKLSSVVLENMPGFINKNEVQIKSYDIEVPKIEMNDEGIYFALEFFEEYSKLKSVNKPLYFAWRNLSSGEYHLLNLLAFLNESIEKAKHNEIIILLDEVEISLHPAWQRNLIKLLVEILNFKAKIESKEIQIIITTHSPFLLSDLPVNALLLLEKNSLGNTKIKNRLEDQYSTLGANIHELYSHSFFLKDGLIGDYAKEKINEVANLLINYNHKTDKPLNWEEIRCFINQVGEPRIKARLIELYDQKNKLSRPLDEEIQTIKGEIEILSLRLKSLEQNKGDIE